MKDNKQKNQQKKQKKDKHINHDIEISKDFFDYYENDEPYQEIQIT